MRIWKGSPFSMRWLRKNCVFRPPWASLSPLLIMQALAPLGPVAEGTLGSWQPVKVRRVPPELSPCLDVAMGYSSHDLP